MSRLDKALILQANKSSGVQGNRYRKEKKADIQKNEDKTDRGGGDSRKAKQFGHQLIKKNEFPLNIALTSKSTNAIK